MSEDKKYERIYGDYFKIIQGTINRMARNSFLIKAWTVTLVSAILVLTLSFTNIFVLGILIVITVIFWGLDSFYLRFERSYRSLYNAKVNEYNNKTKTSMKLFSMDIKDYKKNEESTLKIMRSDSEKYFYITIIVALSLLLIILLVLTFS